jgi:hypothetical protein
MGHPLMTNLSELSTEDLHKKYNELTTKMNQAYRFGPVSIIPQMQMVLEDYRTEMDNRNRKLMDEMESRSDKFKGLIDIKK